jgi:hypothetical protein
MIVVNVIGMMTVVIAVTGMESEVVRVGIVGKFHDARLRGGLSLRSRLRGIGWDKLDTGSTDFDHGAFTTDTVLSMATVSCFAVESSAFENAHGRRRQNWISRIKFAKEGSLLRHDRAVWSRMSFKSLDSLASVVPLPHPILHWGIAPSTPRW